MNTTSQPLVSIVTPVYNGEEYLVECIESVIAQTYQNWEYIIVNNCSTDKTGEIAARYQSRDDRIKLVNCANFLGVIGNHNRAFGLISPASEYCKVVCADDWLFPECVQKLVECAERNPGVGIVGSYSIHSAGIRWIGLPIDRTIFEGFEVCRLYLLGDIDSFGTPTSTLYRSSLLRARDQFYPGSMPNADLAACLLSLETTGFAFVHQILSVLRIHTHAVSSDLLGVGSFLHDRIQFVLEFGPTYLTNEERKKREDILFDELYQLLAVAIVNRRGKEFWDFQRRRLSQVRHEVRGAKLTGAVCLKLADLALNPKQTVEKFLRRSSSNGKARPDR